MTREPVIRVQGLRTRIGVTLIHDGVDLEIQRNQVVAVMGGSGAGKTMLLQEIAMLYRPTAGSIRLFGTELEEIDPQRAGGLRRRMGVMFQQGALLSSLTVLDNVALPLREHTRLSDEMIRELAGLKIALVGLPPATAFKYPRELSGGMLKRAAMARALALDPELLLLDEPTAGLDPVNATAIDELVLSLKQELGLTVFMVTHDMDSLWRVTDRVAFLGDRKVLACDRMEALSGNPHPLIESYFQGRRGRRGRESMWAKN